MRIYIYLVRIAKNFNQLLSKLEKKIKKNPFSKNVYENSLQYFLRRFFLMEEEKKWMLMTYYCPTHGDLGTVKPIEMLKKEISETLLRKKRTPEN